MDLEKLTYLATAFRDAIEQCARHDLPIGFTSFPRGSCGDTTSLLGAYLKDQGMGSFVYIHGESRKMKTHAWLEQNGVIIDITADQFPGITDRVIVMKATDAKWHHRFKQNKRSEADYRIDSRDLAPAYMTK